MGRRYFGTDGVRGRVGEPPITPDFVLKLGWAAGRVLASEGCERVLVGKDTRISGYMFESALEAGLSAAGVDISLLGPLPTPGIAYLTRTLSACAGVVISASHNPYDDNGIKFFARDGSKLPDEIELQIEAMLEEPLSSVDSAHLGKAERIDDARGRYIEFCKGTAPSRMSLKGLKLVVDCANGASYSVAPAVFRELGAEVIPMGVSPDGFNINRNCGATAPQALAEAVRVAGAQMGVALDGDGDRVIMVDEDGTVVDGDELLYIVARDRLAHGKLEGGGVVGTVMSNLGLELALEELGVTLHRAKVGDRYVLECMKANDLILGGESSGHIICLDRTTTGDGIVSALQVLDAAVDAGASLSELKSGMRKFPQALINVPVRGKTVLGNSVPIQTAVKDVECRLGRRGRVLLRPSGTEPVVRVMVEGESAAEVDGFASELAAVVGSELGA